MLATWHFHIEISSKCTLRCPRCARQEVPEGLVNTELDLEFFKHNFTPEFVLANVEKITFCGDDGDPIYAHDLIAVIQYIKSIKSVEIVIVTNGSHKKSQWWADLGTALDSNDSVHFSIDGYDNASNNLYRVNSDYTSIIAGIQALRSASSCQIVWAAIAFKFNQDYIERMQQFAKDLGVDQFQLTKSTKFGSKYPAAYGLEDMLEPTDTSLVAAEHRFERQLYTLSGRARPGKELKVLFLQRATALQQAAQYSGICLIGNKGVFLNSRGEFFPCCWTANRYPHNDQWLHQAQEKFNLNIRPFAEIINDPFWSGDFLKFNSLECTTKCTAARLSDVEHTTEW
jgi:MoaA/NifB/PqqE/SkfB family radical SAM enzyme